MSVPIRLGIMNNLGLYNLQFFKFNSWCGFWRGWLTNSCGAILVLIAIPKLDHFFVLGQNFVPLILRKLAELFHFLSGEQLVLVASLGLDPLAPLALWLLFQLTWVLEGNLVENFFQILLRRLLFLVYLINEVLVLFNQVFSIYKVFVSISNELGHHALFLTLFLKAVPLGARTPVRAGPFTGSAILERSFFIIYVHFFLDGSSRNSYRLGTSISVSLVITFSLRQIRNDPMIQI
jgi:hypothetical protein